MTETPGSSSGGYDPNAAPQEPGYQQAPGYQPPPAQQPPAYQPPPAPEYQAPPAAPEYQAPAGGYQPPAAPAAPQQQWPAQPGAPAPGAPNNPFGNLGQQVGFDPNNLQNFDPKAVNPLDWGIIGAGVLSLLFSFFGYYKYTASINILGVKQSNSATLSAWHGFFGWFGVLVAFLAALALAAVVIAKITLPAPVRLVVLGGFALGLLCTLLALFVVPGNTSGLVGTGIKFDKGHGFSYWLILLLMLAGTGMSFVRFQQTGGKLPNRA